MTADSKYPLFLLDKRNSLYNVWQAQPVGEGVINFLNKSLLINS